MNSDQYRGTLSVFSAIVLCLICMIFPACFQTNENSVSSPIENEPVVVAPVIDLAKPLEISERAEDVALSNEIDEIIEGSGFSNARWGVFVVSLRDGRVLVGRDPRRLFNPASTQKILTSVVALDRLGENFRWKTSVYARENIENGRLSGDLTLYGRGAPDFDDAGLSDLVSQIKRSGLKEITGNIVGDESYFKGDSLGDGWTWNAAQWYYGAAASALSLNQNQLTLTIENGKPRLDTEFVELSGEIEPVEDIEAIGVKRELGTNKVYVWGNGRNLNARLAISNPALLSAKILKEALEKNGIRVGGEARSVDWSATDNLDVEKAVELASLESGTLAEIMRRMNRDSVNLYAELILRTLGKKFGGEAPDENPQMQKLRGDDLAGAAVIKKWLIDQHIAAAEIEIHDGSGLSRLDLVTPESVARALIYAAQASFSQTFTESLPVAGQSGTLRNRLENVPGRIVAKTGSITYVNSLAGFAKRDDETLGFVVFCNNQTQKGESSVVIDKIAARLAGLK